MTDPPTSSPRIRNAGLAATLFFLCSLVSGQTAPPVVVETPDTDADPATFRFNGTITAKREARLSPRVAGLVVVADAETGFSARKGDTLVQLDDTLARIELAQRELAIDAARAERDNAKRRLEEAEQLGDANFPRSERQTRETAFRLSEVAVEQAQAALQRQREIVDRHDIIAPFDGIVVSKSAEVGEWVQTGSPVLHFVGTAELRLDIQVPQEQLDIILQTRSVSIALSGKRKTPIAAEIEARSPKVDPQTRTFMVRLALDQSIDGIKPGMSAEAIFRQVPDSRRLVISRDALIRYDDGRTVVWVIDDSGSEAVARQREVALGNTSGTRIEVVSGLQENERVVVRGNESLQEGQAVRIANSEGREG